jgi:hypothetical protein
LTPRVYRELRRTAANFMTGERQGHTPQATGLVHEVYLRLIDVHYNLKSVRFMAGQFRKAGNDAGL